MKEQIKEIELENFLIKNISKLMLELGKGFAFIGNQYRLRIGDKDYALDLLFYNYKLHCFVKELESELSSSLRREIKK